MAEAILFDLDGTLIDSVGDIATAANLALQDLGLPPRPEVAIRGFIGDGVFMLLRRCLEDRDADDALTEAVERFRIHYDRCALDTTNFFPGVPEVLDQLSCPLGVVSNKPEGFCRSILRGLQTEDRFGAICGGDTFPEKKPSPAPILGALGLLRANATNSVFVGDGLQDMEAARAAGCRAVGVAWGQAAPEDLMDAGAQGVVETPDALLGTLLAS